MIYNKVEIKEHYKELIEHSLNLIFIIDLNGNFIDANAITLNTIRYEKEDLSRLSIKDLLDEVQLEKALKNIQEVASKGWQIRFTEYKVKTKDGDFVYVATNGIPLKKNNQTYAILVMANDISKQKLTELKLKKSERKYRSLFKRIPYSIFLLNFDGIIIDCNSKSEYMFGYKKNEMIGRHFKNLPLIDPTFLPTLFERFQKLLRGESSLPIELKMYKKDEGLIWASLEATLVQISDIQYVQVIIQDISDQKKVEKSLKESEELYRDLYNNAFVGLCTINIKDGRFITANHLSAKIMGYENIIDLLKHHKVGDIFNDAIRKDFIKKLKIRGEIFGYEVHFNDITGNEKDISIWAKLNQDEDLVNISFIDITDLKKMQKALQESGEKYQHLFESAPFLIGLIDLNGNVLDLNSGIKDILTNRTKKDIIGKNITELFSIHEKEKPLIPLFQEQIKRVVNGETVKPFEVPFFRSNGRIQWVNIQGSLMKIQNKPLIQLIIQDITEKKEAEQKLKESEEKFRKIIENSYESYFEVDLAGNFTFFNDALSKLLEYSPDELMGMNYRRLMSKEMVKKTYEIFNNIYNTRIKQKDFESMVITKSGKIVYTTNTIHLRYDSEGNRIGFSAFARDITEKKIAEQKLSESELKYRYLFQRAPFVIGLMDIEGNILDINSAVNSFFTKQSYKDLIGKNIFKEIFSIHEKEKPLIPIFRERLNKLLEGESLKSIEVPLYRSDRRIQWVDMQASLLKFENKTLVQFIFRDITEKKESEQKLSESELKYRYLFQRAPFVIGLMDMEGNILDINSAINNYLTNRTFKDIIGKNIKEIYSIHEKEKSFIPIIQERIKKLLKGETIQPFEHPVYRTDGRIQWVEQESILIKFENKTLVQFIFRDITERKEAEQKLIESEKQFRSIFESIPDIYFLVSGDSTILEYKGNLEDFYIPPEQFLGKKMKDILPQDVGKLGFEAIQKTLQTKEPTIIDYSLPVRGETRFYEARILYYNNDRVIIFIREITDRKKAELIIQEEFSKLKELEQIRKDLISRVSHELKTPLIPVISGTELISTIYKDQIGEQAKDIVEMIHNGGLRLKELIEKLISVSRIEYKKLILNKEKTNLCEIIKKSAADMKYMLEIRKLNLDMNIPEELYLEIDKIRIEEVITNFLSNAIKNTPPDGKIYIELKKEKEWAILSVKDTGVGLTEEEMQILFTRFGKIDRYKEGLEYLDIKGSGLGLYICKEIIDLHGGQIWAQSEGRSKGSSFYINLPIM